ncbi:MAG: DUF4883 family protein [Bacillota bacterium]|nr:DUF4883 family protein [Bacillota bacterium]
MKKRIIFILLFITTLFIVGCNNPLQGKKPNKFYYTNLLAKNLTLESSCNGVILDTNFYKEQKLSNDDLATVKGFVKELRKHNYIEKPKDLPSAPQYKLYLSFSKEEYVIDVYNERYLSIYPWDGDYPRDYLDMKDINTAHNLYYLCKYLIPR